MLIKTGTKKYPFSFFLLELLPVKKLYWGQCPQSDSDNIWADEGESRRATSYYEASSITGDNNFFIEN